MKNKKRNNYKKNKIVTSKTYNANNEKHSDTKSNTKVTYRIIITSFVFTLLFSCLSISYAGLFGGTDDLTTKITKGLTQIQEWILKIATPAAAVSIGFGLLMKKFSFGDEEKITTGKKLIRSTLFSYAFILLIDPIISAIQTLFA